MSHDLDYRLPGVRKADAAPVPAPRRGLVAAVLAAGRALLANRDLRRASRRFRSGKAPPVPDWLRDDVGLPPLPARLPDIWQVWPK